MYEKILALKFLFDSPPPGIVLCALMGIAVLFAYRQQISGPAHCFIAITLTDMFLNYKRFGRGRADASDIQPINKHN